MPPDPTDAEILEWDEGNEAHLARHQITLFDVEDVLDTAVVWVPDMRTAPDRWKVVGYDRGGRALTIVCAYDPVRRALRPVTGWTTTAGERSKYLRESTP
jgi:uncharacterized DUF497 family protein